MLTNAGGQRVQLVARRQMTGKSIDVGPDGQVIESTHIRFESEPAAQRGGVMRRIREWVGGRRP